MVRRNFAGAEAFLDLQLTHGNAFVQCLVQRKLAVSRGREGYEQVADRVIDAVVRRKDAIISIPAIARNAKPGVQRMCAECNDEMQRGSPSITGVIARQPNPPDPGWSDATKKGLNEVVTTVDEKGKIVAGKAATKGVWRVPVEGLSRGLQKGDKGSAFESPGGKAVALIPNIVSPAAPEKEKTMKVDVLVHLHGHGVGYRQTKAWQARCPRRFEGRAVARRGVVSDGGAIAVPRSGSKRLIIAVLPQGSERSDFGNRSSNSDAYLKEVFAKIIPKYLPNGAMPGRVIVSGHSGGGPTAMAVAAQAGKRSNLLLFDAINFVKEEKKVDGKTELDKHGNPVKVCKSPKVCTSNEYGTVRKWVTDRMKAEIQSFSGKSENQQKAELQTNGTRFRGYTSVSLTATHSCSYGFWYKKLKNDIETTIKKLKVSEAVANQLRQNYHVQEAKGLTGFKGNEPHERVMGQGNLEAALKD